MSGRPDHEELAPVLAAYGFGDQTTMTRISIGLVNRTYRVESGNQLFILQRLHPAFHGSVNLDIDAITQRLLARGMITPELVRTQNGEAWVVTSGHVYRVLTFLDGTTIDHIATPDQAWEAGALVARFHRALADFDHTFHFTRPGAHDTEAHLQRLAEAHRQPPGEEDSSTVDMLARRILEFAKDLPVIPALPTRIIHGDLKISNVLFDPAARHARALIDLDTMCHGTIAVELGDAFRSWCNPAGEDDPNASFSEELFRAALEGYRSASILEPIELQSVVVGTETIAFELASRFCLDAYENRYFGWDPSRFESRTEHNLVRARSQLSLARSIRTQRAALRALVA